MKRITYIILGVTTMLLSLASCNRKIEFEHKTFVSFYSSSYSVKEDAGKVLVPVTLYNGGGKEVNVTVTVTPDANIPATKDVDYKILKPESGVLTFAPGEDTKNIEIEVIEHAEVVTGTLAFSISIASATEGVTVGTLAKVPFTIADNDVPFTWFGHWTGTAADQYGKYPMDIEITDNGDGTVTVTNLEPWLATKGITADSGFQKYKGQISSDDKMLTVAKGQMIGLPTSAVDKDGDDSTPLLICGFPVPNPSQLVLTDIIINRNDDGTLVIPNAFGMYGGSTLYGLYPGGVILTYVN